MKTFVAVLAAILSSIATAALFVLVVLPKQLLRAKGEAADEAARASKQAAQAAAVRVEAAKEQLHAIDTRAAGDKGRDAVDVANDLILGGDLPGHGTSGPS